MKIVSFETAKLAKEKGFSIGCDWQYDEFGNIVDGLYMPHYFKAPYQYQLLDWLREEYKIFVTIYPYIKTSLNNWQSCVWVYPLNENKEITGSAMYYNFGTGLGYYECLETALQEALKLI